MGDISIRRESPYPPGINDGFTSGCAHLAIVTHIANRRSSQKFEFSLVLWELSVSLVDDNEMREINNRFRNINESTDVLSFPQYEPAEIDELLNSHVISESMVLGDIVISLEWVKRESKNDFDILRRSYAWMMLHGILHLFGLDHETPEEEKKMREEENRILLEMDSYISGVRK